jgi:cytosine/adenosine deaminase-related metal-dependent hydrolase
VALVLKGQIVPLDAADPNAVFGGRVFIDDQGTIEAVTQGTAPAPAGFTTAPAIDVGNAFVLPGLIDLHNHIGYNTLPLWAEPSQQTAWAHHDSWTRAATYQGEISWPANALIQAAGEAALAYVQLRALVGGTTSIQGWPSASRQHVQVLRHIDDETAGTTNHNLILTSALTKKPLELAKVAQRMHDGAGFIYHCAEGQMGSLVTREFIDVANAGCLVKTFIGVHCNAIDDATWTRWSKTQAGAVAWSPFSNLWLYGTTTDITAARGRNVAVCLGSDWGPSGTKNVQGELKVAKLATGPWLRAHRSRARRHGDEQPWRRADAVLAEACRATHARRVWRRDGISTQRHSDGVAADCRIHREGNHAGRLRRGAAVWRRSADDDRRTRSIKRDDHSRSGPTIRDTQPCSSQHRLVACRHQGRTQGGA